MLHNFILIKRNLLLKNMIRDITHSLTKYEGPQRQNLNSSARTLSLDLATFYYHFPQG